MIDNVQLQDVVKTICILTKKSYEEMIGPGKKRHLVVPRMLIYYFASKLVKMPILQIAHRLNRDHSTIFHGLKAFEKKHKPQILEWDLLEECFYRTLSHIIDLRREKIKKLQMNPLIIPHGDCNIATNS